jgi:hypothetical protein
MSSHFFKDCRQADTRKKVKIEDMKMTTKQSTAFAKAEIVKNPFVLESLNLSSLDLWRWADTYFERYNGMWQNLDMKLTLPIYVNGKQWLNQSLISEIGEIFHSITEELQIDAESAIIVTKGLILKRDGKQIDHDERTEKIYFALNEFLDEEEAAIRAQKEIDKKLKSLERDVQKQRDH